MLKRGDSSSFALRMTLSSRAKAKDLLFIYSQSTVLIIFIVLYYFSCEVFYIPHISYEAFVKIWFVAY